jgi:hypothetical protein
VTSDDIESNTIKPRLDAGHVIAIRSQIHELVTQELRYDLGTGAFTEKELSAAIKTLQGKLAPSEIVSNTPFSRFVTVNGIRSAVAAYVVAEGGVGIPDTHPLLEFYSRDNGTWKLKAQAPTESDFESRTFFVSPIDLGLSNETFFLVSGFQIGDTGTRLRVKLYAYNGESVRTVWERDNLTYGTVNLSKDVITLDYSRKYHSVNASDQVHQEFQVVPGGVQCLTPDCTP